ncbi:MAG: hypothetical protein D6814_01590 [Calditrichaeota bacterium]|nr:MAG: hypothetical protein D6814_01590 [Calditrichota bacterium]
MGQSRAVRSPAFRGLVINLEFPDALPAKQYLMGHDFSDETFSFFLAATRGYLSERLMQQARELTAEQRFPFLLQHGLLPLYYKTLEDEAERFGRTLRRIVNRVSPNLILGVFTPYLPDNWYLVGVMRGLSRPQSPVILFTHEAVVQPYLQWLRQEDIFALHVLAIYPWRFDVPELESLVRSAARFHHGFCLYSWEALMNPAGVPMKQGPISLASLAEILRSAWNKQSAAKD